MPCFASCRHLSPLLISAFTVFFPQATTALEAIEGRHVPNFGFLYINYNDHGYAKVLDHHSLALSLSSSLLAGPCDLPTCGSRTFIVDSKAAAIRMESLIVTPCCPWSCLVAAMSPQVKFDAVSLAYVLEHLSPAKIPSPLLRQQLWLDIYNMAR